MLVEGAERFGLSQLHQLRGRVGRGEHESFCILFGDPESEAAKARLEAIAAEADGFALAEVDLSIRGEGEILGTRQHGLPRFRAASLPEDTALLLEARRRVLELRERTARSRRRSSGRCSTRRGGASATSASSRSRPEWPSCESPAASCAAAGSRRPEGSELRPTTERVREAVFSILGDVSGARVLDLFCGTGALAIEALSRGARRGDARRHPAARGPAQRSSGSVSRTGREVDPRRRRPVPAPSRAGLLRSRALRPAL